MTKFKTSTPAAYGSAFGLTEYGPSYVRRAGNGDVYFYTTWQATKASGENDISNEVTRLSKDGKRLPVPATAKLGDMGGFKAILSKTWTGSNTSDVDEMLKGSGSQSKSAPLQKAQLTSTLLGSTWNDGRYTYVISSNGAVETGGKTFKDGDATYTQIVNALNGDLGAGKLKRGAVVRAASASPPPANPVTQQPVESESGITSSAFFWPGVILGATAIGAGTYFIFFSK